MPSSDLFSAETKDQIIAHLNLRKQNLNPVRPDGSIKKNTSFIKKLKAGITAASYESLVKDLKSLKVEKYLEEIAVSIVEGTFKTSADVWAAVEISSLLHSQFQEFQKMLVDAVMKSCASLNTVSTIEKEEVQRITKQRSNIRFLTELYLVGLIIDGPKEKDWVIPTILAGLFSNDKQHGNVSLGAAFAKFYAIYFLPTDSCTDFDQEQVSLRAELVPEPVRIKTHKYLTIYLKTVMNRLTKDHAKLLKLEKSRLDIMISQAKENENDPYEKLQKSFEKLHAQAQILAQYTLTEMPEFEKKEEQIFTISVSEGKKEELDVGIWDDEDQKAFYEVILDLANQVPMVLLGKQAVKSQESVEKLEPVVDVDLNAPAEADVDPESTVDSNADGSADEPTDDPEVTIEDSAEDAKEGQTSNTKAKLQEIFSKMQNALNKDAIDALAVEFAFLNNKGSRKQMVQTLLAVPRQRLELLPFYSRMVATLNKYMPDIGASVIEELQSSFRYHQRKKNQIFIEEKLKNIRFIAELTKFKVMPLPVIFSCMKRLLDDFVFHNIELLCALLENCGRYLFSMAITKPLMTQLLEIMNRKKTVGNFDTKYIFMIENAMFSCNPPEVASMKPKKERPVIELFIRKIVYGDLKRSTVAQTLKWLRKLNWNDPATKKVLEKIFSKIWKVKYSSIHLMAFLLSELSRFYPDFGVFIVDHTLEMIRVGLESNLFKWNQKRISCIKFLGELYRYRMVDSTVVFDTLYLLTRFGHVNGIPLQGVICPIDKPNDFFRIRLVCTLLDTIGPFKKPANTKKLDDFIIFLQLYVYSKIPMPMDVEFFYTETLESISVTPLGSFEECAIRWNEIVQEVGFGVETDAGDAEEEADTGLEEDEDGHGSDGVDQVEEIQVVEPEQEINDPIELESDHENDQQFDQELKRMMQESLDSRKLDKKSGFDVAIPTRPKQKPSSTPSDKIAFAVLTKGGKLKSIDVPLTSVFVKDTLEAKIREEKERGEVKKMVLKLEETRVDEQVSIEPIWNAPAKGKRWDDDDFQI